MSETSAKLTKPMTDLLEEIREHREDLPSGGLWISRYKPYWRTAKALEARGLVKIVDKHYGSDVYFFAAVDQA